MKPGHLCFRRISANMLPVQKFERQAARAVEAFGRDAGRGPGGLEAADHFQVWSVDEFVSRMFSAFRHLIILRPYLDECIQCHSRKGLVSLAHGDSSQMYDEVVESVVSDSFEEQSAREIAKRRPNTVTVSTGRRGRSFMGGSVHPKKGKKRPGMRVWTRPLVSRMLKFSAKTAVSRVGKHVFRRLRGVTMGGSLSPAKAGQVYRHFERRFLRSRAAWRRWGMACLQHQPPGPISRVVSAVRIADDDIAMSAVHCATCLARLGGKPYPPPLKHGNEGAGSSVTVVDLAVDTEGLVMKVVRLNRNVKYIMGVVHNQTRVRYLPPLQAPIVTRRLRSSWIAGTLALDEARSGLYSHRVVQGLLTMLELLRLKHTPAQLIKALHCIRHPKHVELCRFLAQCLSVVKRFPDLGYYSTVALFWALMQPCIMSFQSHITIPTAVEQ